MLSPDSLLGVSQIAASLGAERSITDIDADMAGDEHALFEVSFPDTGAVAADDDGHRNGGSLEAGLDGPSEGSALPAEWPPEGHPRRIRLPPYHQRAHAKTTAACSAFAEDESYRGFPARGWAMSFLATLELCGFIRPE